MKLNLGTFEVKDVQFAEKTYFENGVLYICAEELKQLILEEPAIQSAEIHIVKPGEDKRIIHVLDTIEPRIKLDKDMNIFPGQLSTMPYTVGNGTTLRLNGVTVMESCMMPIRAGGLLIPREAIVDMTGPGKVYSPFGDLINIVLAMEIADDFSDIEYDAAVRNSGLRVSIRLAETVKEMEPDSWKVWSNDERNPELPNVVHIHQYQSQGNFAHTYSYGKHMYENLPTLISGNELMDGALVSSNYAYGCYKTPTYLHQNNPVMLALYKDHGIKHNYLGEIISRGHNYTFAEKLRSAQFAAKVAKEIGADGAIVTWEGGGNSIIEAMQTVKACENMGIKTVIAGYELGGPDGDEVAMLDCVPEADAIVSTASIDKVINLPELTPVGGDQLRLYPENGGIFVDAKGPLEFALSHEMYTGAGQSAFGYFTSREY